MDLEIVDRLRELADDWDRRLRAEYGVDSKYSDWHADELRAALDEKPEFHPRIVGVKNVDGEWLPVVEL